MTQTPEVLAQGYGLIEGPVWDAARGLLFSDVIHGGVYCMPAGGGAVQTVIEHRRGIGGMALHERGGLVVSGRNVGYKPPQGETAVLLDAATAATGVIGFNDLTTDPEGRVYVGSLCFSPIAEERPADPPTGFLHVIELDGSTRVLAEGIQLTNGLAVAPDGRRLYHCDSLSHCVWMYERHGDGSVGPRRPFAAVDEGIPDGCAVSEDGALWVAVAHGGKVLVLEPDGSRRTEVPIPLSMVTSVCFGGAELRELFVATGSRGTDSERGAALFRLHVDVPGLPVAPARVRMP